MRRTRKRWKNGGRNRECFSNSSGSFSFEMDDRANPLQREHSLCVVLPGGLEKSATVHGSKPVMDLLVTLCAGYHLNPSDYTVEFLSANKNNISFKPNSPIGLLEAEKMVLKPKASEEKAKKPYMPEATVRLLINYNKSHKTVVRVSPVLPLEKLLPAVCDKCEFDVETTVLLRDSQSREPLDLRRSLNEHGLRELYAKDTALKDPTVPAVWPPEARLSQETNTKDLLKKGNKQKKRGFFSLFRRKKNKLQPNGTASAPASPSLCRNVQRGSECNSLPPNSSKKRRAPPPPMLASQSIPGSLSNCSERAAQASAESNLRSTKRRAPPPPPCVNTDVRDSVCPLEDIKDGEEPPCVNSSSRSSSPPGRRPSPCSSFPLSPEDSKLHPHSFLGKDLSDARSALAKVLTSSVSKGTLAKRLRNSASFPKFNVSSCISVDSDRREDKDASSEPESVLDLKLPTENEDVQRRGMTTFKVVPTKKLSDFPERLSEEEDENPALPDGEVKVNSEDHCQPTPVDNTSTSLPSGKDSDDQNSSEKPSCEADEEEGEVIETPSDLKEGENLNEMAESQEEIPHRLSPDSGIPREEMNAVQEEEEVGFPPPPPPVFFKEDGNVPEREASLASALNERTQESSQDAPGPSPERRTSAPSRFAEAVAMAVNRSRLHSLGKTPEVSGDPNGAPARSTYQYGA